MRLELLKQLMLSLNFEPFTCSITEQSAPQALNDLYKLLPGGYLLGGAIKMFPLVGCHESCSINDWNHTARWRRCYRLQEGCTFFAYNILGEQFGVIGDTIFSMDPETGRIIRKFRTIEEWGEILLDDQEDVSARTVLRKWADWHGPAAKNSILVPVKPFVIGGQLESNNLFELPEDEAMCYLGHFASSIRDMPDGTVVEVRVEE